MTFAVIILNLVWDRKVQGGKKHKRTEVQSWLGGQIQSLIVTGTRRGSTLNALDTQETFYNQTGRWGGFREDI